MSSPSGAGKTTLSRKLLGADANISMSVSVTTRKPRPGEVDGRDYHFISQAQFDKMVHDKQLLEWATVFGNSYGTPRKPVEVALNVGCDVLFDIDWQGTQQLAQAMEDDLVRIFILPPSAEILRDRLIGRNQDSSVVAKRMAEAPRESATGQNMIMLLSTMKSNPRTGRSLRLWWQKDFDVAGKWA